MLTDQRYGSLCRSHNAIANVLSGRSADGITTISSKVSFTNDTAARAAAAQRLRIILCHCHRVLNDDDITPLTIKLLWYLTRKCGRTQEAINTFPVITAIRAIQHAPHLVSSKASLTGILKHYKQYLQQERAKQWRTLNEDVPERTLLWTDGAYTLEEANDPRHLLNDSLQLGHCVGTLHNTSALAIAKLTADHPKAIHCLVYWMKIKSGESRIITLLQAGKPLITIHYTIASRTIVHAQGRITVEGQLLPIPASAKAPLISAIKALPLRKGGSRLLKSLPFEPVSPGPDHFQLAAETAPHRALN